MTRIDAGKTPINLDSFRTLPSVRVEGAKNIGRLTNLKNLTIDTSYYQRYRQAGNPDFGDTFPQIVNIVNQPTVPTSESIRGDELRSIAQTAAFHFASIEQGGSSLYNSFMTKVTNLDVVKFEGPVDHRVGRPPKVRNRSSAVWSQVR